MLDLLPPIDDAFRALADPTRRQIIEHLDAGPVSVSTLARPFPITLAAVARHVQILESAGVISTTKVGRERICELDLDRIDTVRSWLDDRRRRWERRLDRLDEHITAVAHGATDQPHDQQGGDGHA